VKYIFLIAGKGTRLQPLTLKMPKPLYRLDQNTTVLERMVKIISKHDPQAQFVIVVGFCASDIMARLEHYPNIRWICNPFYQVTNSIASLWFAREELDGEVTILNGDIVMEEELVRQVVCQHTQRPLVLVDSSVKTQGDYNVQVLEDKVLVMSKNLDEYYGEYAGVSKLDGASTAQLRRQIEAMVRDEMYDQWYENALVQMVFSNDFQLYYEDISNYSWTEVDCVDDMLLAKRIHRTGR
jgi:choline kinase